MSNVDTHRLAAMVRAKREEEKKGLRKVSEETDVSASTLSRVESGHLPDLDTYVKLCRWLGVSAEEFTADRAGQQEALKKPVEVSTADFLTAHLRADKNLPPETAEALSKMIQIAYAQADWLKQNAQWQGD